MAGLIFCVGFKLLPVAVGSFFCDVRLSIQGCGGLRVSCMFPEDPIYLN